MADERQMQSEIGRIEPRHVERYTFASKYVKDKDVIDVACGCGYGSNILSKTAKSVIGGDFSEVAVNYAKKHWSNDNITFQQTNIKDKPKLGDADVFVSLETLEHIDHELVNTLDFYKKNLKKDGLLIMSHPDNEEDLKINPYHVHFNITRKSMVKLLNDNGFEIVEVMNQKGYDGYYNYLLYVAKLV